MQVHLGCVELQPAPDPVELNREMIALALKFNVGLKSDNSQLLEENRRLKQQRQIILQEYDWHAGRVLLTHVLLRRKLFVQMEDANLWVKLVS